MGWTNQDEEGARIGSEAGRSEREQNHILATRVRSEMPIGFSGGNCESVGVSLEIREELRAGVLWES